MRKIFNFDGESVRAELTEMFQFSWLAREVERPEWPAGVGKARPGKPKSTIHMTHFPRPKKLMPGIMKIDRIRRCWRKNLNVDPFIFINHFKSHTFSHFSRRGQARNLTKFLRGQAWNFLSN